MEPTFIVPVRLQHLLMCQGGCFICKAGLATKRRFYLCRLLQEAKGQPWASPQAQLFSQWQCSTPAGSCGFHAQPSQALQSLFGALAGQGCPMLPGIDPAQGWTPYAAATELLSEPILPNDGTVLPPTLPVPFHPAPGVHCDLKLEASSHRHGRIITV